MGYADACLKAARANITSSTIYLDGVTNKN